MWSRAQLLVLLTVLYAHGNHAQEDSTLQVGKSVDIFTRYGYLSLTVKVVPRNETFLFREPTIDIFTDLEKYAIHARKAKKQRQVFEGNFHMEFCENSNQLLQAYFRGFNLQGLDKPWKAFSGSWSPETIGRNLGINSSFIYSDSYCFVLVRLSRYRESGELTRIPNNINLSQSIAREIEKIKFGDVSSVMMFVQKYGSHFVNSYITGNSIYQVFVYNKSNFYHIKDRLKSRGIAHINKIELQQYFGPTYAEQLGKILVASGNKTVARWIEENLRINYFIFSFQSLFKIHGNTSLLSALNNLLKNEAVVELDLKTIAPAFKDPIKRQWFEEVLNNTMHLWEVNL